MGYNRGGKNRTDRLKRRKKEEARLARKAAGQTPRPAETPTQVK
jgi:hypothetical protein